MELVKISQTKYKEWNNFVDQSPQGSIYSKTWYLDAYDANYQIWSVQNDNDILAGIVLCKNKTGLYQNPLLSKYLGVLFKKFEGKNYTIETRKRKTLGLLIPQLRKHSSFSYNFHPGFCSYLPFYWEGYGCALQYTYQIDLINTSKEKIFSHFSSRLKNKIHLAEKQNFEFHENIDFEIFYEIIEKTFTRQGILARTPWTYNRLNLFFQKLRAHDAIQLNGLTDTNGKFLAVNGIVFDLRSSNMLFNGVDYTSKQSGANELLIFKTIQNSIPKTHVFDFEGSMISPIESFYRTFGGKQISYLKIFKDNIFNYLFSKSRTLYRKMIFNK